MDLSHIHLAVKFGFSEKATKFEKIFVVLLTRASCSVRATVYLSKSRRRFWTWNSTTEIAIGKVLPCNKKVMSLTPDRDNILKTWVHVVLNLMKCILQLIGLNKLKGQYTYVHTSTFSLPTFFSMLVHCT